MSNIELASDYKSSPFVQIPFALINKLYGILISDVLGDKIYNVGIVYYLFSYDILSSSVCSLLF